MRSLQRVITLCPHYGFDIYSTFYQGLNIATKQFIEMMCNGEFLSKDIEDAYVYLNSLAENSRVWKIKDAFELSQPIAPTTRDRLIKLGETKDIAMRLIILTKKLTICIPKNQCRQRLWKKFTKFVTLASYKAISLKIIQLF